MKTHRHQTEALLDLTHLYSVPPVTAYPGGYMENSAMASTADYNRHLGCMSDKTCAVNQDSNGSNKLNTAAVMQRPTKRS